MFYGIDMGRIAVEALPDHPAYFSMVIDPGAEKFSAGAKDEVALHFFPDVLELIMIGPDVVPGAGDNILARGGDKSGRSGLNVGAYVPMAFENADGLGGSGSCIKKKEAEQWQQAVRSFGFHATNLWSDCSNGHFWTTSILHQRSKWPINKGYLPHHHYIKTGGAIYWLLRKTHKSSNFMETMPYDAK